MRIAIICSVGGSVHTEQSVANWPSLYSARSHNATH